jgi:hypothetical protein
MGLEFIGHNLGINFSLLPPRNGTGTAFFYTRAEIGFPFMMSELVASLSPGCHKSLSAGRGFSQLGAFWIIIHRTESKSINASYVGLMLGGVS